MRKQTELYKYIREITTQYDIHELTAHQVATKIEDYININELHKTKEFKIVKSLSITTSENYSLYLSEGTLFINFLQEALRDMLKKIDIHDFVKKTDSFSTWEIDNVTMIVFNLLNLEGFKK